MAYKNMISTANFIAKCIKGDNIMSKDTFKNENINAIMVNPRFNPTLKWSFELTGMQA